jgi:site-specific recombinase XerC
MTTYADAIVRAPKSLTETEQRLLLKTSGEHRDGFRDHVLFSVALGTALREHEILALDVGDVYDDAGRAKTRVRLRVFKRSNPDASMQEVILPDAVRAKLDKLYKVKRSLGEALSPDAPLFVSREGSRLSARQARRAFAVWQARAGFERRLSFHSMRHRACSALYERTKDLRLVQRYARHRSINSTVIYTHPSDEALVRAVRSMPA